MDRKKIVGAGFSLFVLMGGICAWSFATTGDWPFADAVRAKLAAATGPVAVATPAPDAQAQPQAPAQPDVQAAPGALPGEDASTAALTTEQIAELASRMAAEAPPPIPAGASSGLQVELLPIPASAGSAKAFLDGVRAQAPLARGVVGTAFDFVPEFYAQSVRPNHGERIAVSLKGYLNVPEGRGGKWVIGGSVGLAAAENLRHLGLFPSAPGGATGFHVVAGAVTDAKTGADASLFFDVAGDDLLGTGGSIDRGGVVELQPGLHPVSFIFAYDLACAAFNPVEPCKSPAATGMVSSGTTVRILVAGPGEASLRAPRPGEFVVEGR